MTTSTTSLSRRHVNRPPAAAPVAEFHAPPLRPAAIDIARDLAVVRQRRAALTQRVGAVWIRGHAHG